MKAVIELKIVLCNIAIVVPEGKIKNFANIYTIKDIRNMLIV